MNCKHVFGDENVAGPTAEIAVMGAGRALNGVFRDEVSRSTGPNARHRRLVVEYEAESNNPGCRGRPQPHRRCHPRV